MSRMPPPDPVRVLYIDDDAAFVRLTQRALARQGFVVTHAPSGRDGLALLRDVTFDAVALDHVMPGLSGPETLAGIVAMADAPPVVYVTAADAGRVAVDALKAGASDFMLNYLGESFFNLLGQTIRQAIGALRAEREGREAVLDLQRRVVAVGQIHRRLYTSQAVRSVDLADYLQGLVDELALSMADDGRVSGIVFAADPLEVPTDRAISLEVIVSELVTNALKYAYRDRPPGPIRVGLSRISPDVAEVRVADDGVGIGNSKAIGSGLGARILAAMARSLRAELIHPEASRGTDVRARFRISADGAA